MIEILIPSIPIAQPRQKHRLAKYGEKSFIQNYTPTDSPVNSFKAVSKLVAKVAMKGLPPFLGPLRVDVEFVLPRPKRLVWKNKKMPRERHIIKPDRDNLEKSIFDALNGIVWGDDCQVCAGKSKNGSHPGTKLRTFG